MRGERNRRGALFLGLMVVCSVLALIAPALVPGLYRVLPSERFLPLHSTLELAVILVCLLVFTANLLAYLAARRLRVLVLGSAFLAMGLIELWHLLTYQGMPNVLTSSSSQKAMLFWLVARLTGGSVLLWYTASGDGKEQIEATKPGLVLRAALFPCAAVLLSAAILLAGARYGERLPPLVIPGHGVSTLKIALGIVAAILYAASALLVWRRRKTPWEGAVPALAGGLLLGAVADAAFTRYLGVTDTYNLLGHVFQLVSDVLILVGIAGPQLRRLLGRVSLLSTMRRQIVAAFVVVLLAMSTVIGVYTVSTSWSELHARARAEFMLGAQDVADHISMLLEDSGKDLLAVAGTPPIAGILRAEEAGGYDARGGASLAEWLDRLRTIMGAFIASHEAYTYLALTDEEGRDVLRVTRDERAEPAAQRVAPGSEGASPRNVPALAGRPGIVTVASIVGENNGDRAVLVLTTPIVDERKEPRALLAASVDLGRVVRRASELLEGAGRGVFVVDLGGRYAYRTGGVFSALGQDFASVVSRARLVSGGPGTFTAGSMEVFYDAVTLPSEQSPTLLAGLLVPRRTLEAPIRRNVAAFAAAFVFFVAVAIVLGSFVAARVISPLERLRQGVRDTAEGRKAFLSDPGGSREIRDLTRDVNTMSARLFERTTRLKRLYELALTAHGNMEETAAQVAGMVAQLWNMPVTVVERLEDGVIRALALYDRGRLVRGAEFPLSGTPCERVRLERQACVYDRAAERFPEDQFLAEHGIVTYAGLPIFAGGGEVIGVIAAMDDCPREMAGEDLELLRILAQWMGLQMERAEAEHALGRRAGELGALYAVAERAGASLNTEELIRDVQQEMLSLEPFRASYGLNILLLDEKEQLLRLRTPGRIVPSHPCLHAPVKVGECICGLAASTGETVVSENACLDERHQRRWAGMPEHRDVCIPLKARARVLGVLQLALPIERSVEEGDLALMTGIARQIAVGLDNARLYNQIRERAAELGRSLVQEHQYAQNVLRSIADGVYSVNLEREILTWSHGAQVTTGFSAQEVVGCRCRDVLGHEDEAGNRYCDTPLCPFEQIRATGSAIGPMEVFCHAKDGVRRSVSVTAAPIVDGEGNQLGAVQVFRDVSKERELRERLESANRAKSRFLAGMSHELRTPLNAVIGFSELLQTQSFGPLSERQARFLDNIRKSGHHLLQLVNSVLDLSKIDAGKMDLSYERFRLDEALAGAVELVGAAAAEKGIAVHLHAPADLPPLVADPVRVRQIVLNLVSNAVKCTPKGGRIEVTARWMEDAGEMPRLRGRYPRPGARWFSVSVHDTGIGIDGRDMDRIWEEFEQLEQTHNGPAGGTGLGLPLARRLVEMHGGHIQARSDGRGKGSTFTFVLPERELVAPVHAIASRGDGVDLTEGMASVMTRALLSGQRAVYVGADEDCGLLQREMSRRGVAVADARAEGLLRFISSRRLYAPQGRFDADRAAEEIHTLIQSAPDGLAEVWIGVDVSWLGGSDSPADALLAYERRLGEALSTPRPPLTVVCAYSVNRHSRTEIEAISRLHRHRLTPEGTYAENAGQEARG